MVSVGQGADAVMRNHMKTRSTRVAAKVVSLVLEEVIDQVQINRQEHKISEIWIF